MFELVVKLLIIAAVLLAAVGAGMVPILAKQWRRSERLLSLANALAGGLFLGAGFLHLLPQSHQDFGGILDYPMAPLLAAVGVCGLLFVERVVFESVKPEGAGTARPIYTYALLVVLSTHSVIAGVAIGLEDTFVAASVMVAIAILFYQGSAAFTLVSSLLASGVQPKQARPLLATFALMAPIGIAIGVVTASLLGGDAETIVAACFLALAAGTFIYVGMLDVINKEMSTLEERVADFTRSVMRGDDDVPMPVKDRDRVLKMLLILIGVAAIALMGVHQP